MRVSYLSLCHVIGAVVGRGDSKLRPTPYRRKGLSSQREVLNLFLALGPIGPVLLLVRGLDFVTANDREKVQKN